MLWNSHLDCLLRRRGPVRCRRDRGQGPLCTPLVGTSECGGALALPSFEADIWENRKGGIAIRSPFQGCHSPPHVERSYLHPTAPEPRSANPRAGASPYVSPDVSPCSRHQMSLPRILGAVPTISLSTFHGPLHSQSPSFRSRSASPKGGCPRYDLRCPYPSP